MNSKEMFKAILKAYTGPSLHEAFKTKLIGGKYVEISRFLAAYIKCVNDWGQEFAYQQFQEPLFLGVDQLE